MAAPGEAADAGLTASAPARIDKHAAGVLLNGHS